jgi:hypothetical protein
VKDVQKNGRGFDENKYFQISADVSMILSLSRSTAERVESIRIPPSGDLLAVVVIIMAVTLRAKFKIDFASSSSHSRFKIEDGNCFS